MSILHELSKIIIVKTEKKMFEICLDISIPVRVVRLPIKENLIAKMVLLGEILLSSLNIIKGHSEIFLHWYNSIETLLFPRFINISTKTYLIHWNRLYVILCFNWLSLSFCSSLAFRRLNRLTKNHFIASFTIRFWKKKKEEKQL